MHIDITSIISVAVWLIPIIIGIFIQSPVGRKLPPAVSGFLATIDPMTLAQVAASVSSKDARRQTAIDEVMSLASHNRINIDDKAAGQIVDALTMLYKRGILRQPTPPSTTPAPR